MSPGSSRIRIRNLFEPLERNEVAELWHARFGIPPEVFLPYRFFRKAQSVWIMSDAELPRLSYEALGMRFMNLKDRPWKPTTSALQIFGKHATRNLVHLDDAMARLFLAGESQATEEATEGEMEAGYVVVFYKGEVLGCGLYSRGRLASQLPKERRMAMVGEEEGEDAL